SEVNPWRLPPDLQALGHEQTKLIEHAIADLPEPYRDVYVLADVEGLPNAEIGDMLGLSLPAVKSRLHRGRLVMRNSLPTHFAEGAQCPAGKGSSCSSSIAAASWTARCASRFASTWKCARRA